MNLSTELYVYFKRSLESISFCSYDGVNGEIIWVRNGPHCQ